MNSDQHELFLKIIEEYRVTQKVQYEHWFLSPNGKFNKVLAGFIITEVMNVEYFQDKIGFNFNEHVKKHYGIELRYHYTKLNFTSKRSENKEPTVGLVSAQSIKGRYDVKGKRDMSTRSKRTCDCKAIMTFKCCSEIKKWKVFKMDNIHTGHPIAKMLPFSLTK